MQTQALEAGRIDAAALDPVFSRRLKQKGFTVLSELYQANLPFIGSGIVVSDSFIREQPEALENIIKAVVEAIAFVLGPKIRPIVVNTIKARLKIADPALAEEGYQDVLKSLEKNPTPSLDSMRNMHRLLGTRNPSMDKVKPEQLIDDRIMRKLDESALSVACTTRTGMFVAATSLAILLSVAYPTLSLHAASALKQTDGGSNCGELSQSDSSPAESN